MGCIQIVFGFIMPRLALIAGWNNDPNYWENVLGGPLLFAAGFLALPWVTLIYGFASQNGLSLFDWLFLAGALVLDLGTWGVGYFGGRKEVSNFRNVD